MTKIAVLDGYTLNPGDLNWEEIQGLGNCTIYDRTAPEQILERCSEAEVILTNKVIIDAGIMAQLPALKYIGVLATGFNVVDIDAASQRGIIVTNIPAYSTASVAQQTFSHILHFAQNISNHAESVRKGDWAGSVDFCYRLTPQMELEGKTLGIIGFGKIGQAVARIGKALGMGVIYQNRSIKSVPDIKASQVEMEELLAVSDFISINCPLTEENKGFINMDFLRKMKSTAYLVNTGRGPLINEEHLAEALNEGVMAGAGLDVLSEEPPQKDNPLFKAKNCNITPHIAWATLEARSRLMGIARDNINAWKKGNPHNVVNS